MVEINYRYAHILLKPEKFPIEPDWKEKFKDGEFISKSGLLHLLVDNCVLEMHDITIPPSGAWRFWIQSRKMHRAN